MFIIHRFNLDHDIVQYFGPFSTDTRANKFARSKKFRNYKIIQLVAPHEYEWHS